MRKKQANIYSIEKNLDTPPYLTKQQIKDFQSEFTLFDKSLNLIKLKEAMQGQNYHNSCKPVYKFIQNQIKLSDQIQFQDYLNHMKGFLAGLNQGQLISQVLDQSQKGQFQKQYIKQLLQEAMGREILATEMNEIMQALFEVDQKTTKIGKNLIKDIVNEEKIKQKR